MRSKKTFLRRLMPRNMIADKTTAVMTTSLSMMTATAIKTMEAKSGMSTMTVLMALIAKKSANSPKTIKLSTPLCSTTP